MAVTRMMTGSTTSVVATHAAEGEFRAKDEMLVIFTALPRSVKRVFARVLREGFTALFVTLMTVGGSGLPGKKV